MSKKPWSEKRNLKPPQKDTARYEKMVSLAFLRMTGASQLQAAMAVEVGERTVALWEQQTWWFKVKGEARARFLPGIIEEARLAAFRLCQQNDGATVRWVLDRLDPAFARKLAVHLTDRDGNEREVQITDNGPAVQLYLPENDRPDLSPGEVQDAQIVETLPHRNGKAS